MKETKTNSEKANVVVNANMEAVAATTQQIGKKTTKEKKAEEVKPTPAEAEKPKTAEQLQAEFELQQKEVERVQKELQKKLQELEEKQKLNRNRSKFLETLDNLDEFEGKLQVEEDFETNICRIKFAHGSYSDKEIFTVSNTALLLDFIAFMRERIKNKVSDIEKLLLL